MNYYQFHIGDYAAHTRSLGLLEDLAYRRLLDAYYVNESPLRGSVDDVAREIGMREHLDAVEYVLSRFFVRDGDTWTNSRAEREIARFHDKSAKAAKAGKASAERRFNVRSTDVPEKPTDVCKSSTNVQPTNNQEPITNTPSIEGVTRTRKRAPAARPADVAESVWEDFQRLRAEKRASLTDTALAGIRREAAKAGIPLEAALAYCCEQGWQGFNAGWYAERMGGIRARASPASRHEAAARAIYGAPTSPEFIDVEAVVRQH